MTSARSRWEKHDEQSAVEAERTAESRLRQQGIEAAKLAKTTRGNLLIVETLAKLDAVLAKRNEGAKPRIPPFKRESEFPNYEANLLAWNQRNEQRRIAILSGADMDNKELEVYWGDKYKQKASDLNALQEMYRSLQLIGLAVEYKITQILPDRYLTKALSPEQSQSAFKDGWDSIEQEDLAEN